MMLPTGKTELLAATSHTSATRFLRDPPYIFLITLTFTWATSDPSHISAPTYKRSHTTNFFDLLTLSSAQITLLVAHNRITLVWRNSSVETLCGQQRIRWLAGWLTHCTSLSPYHGRAWIRSILYLPFIPPSNIARTLDSGSGSLVPYVFYSWPSLEGMVSFAIYRPIFSALDVPPWPPPFTLNLTTDAG